MTYLGIGSPIPTLKTLRETTVTWNYPVASACEQDGVVTPSIKDPLGGTFSATPSTGLTIDSNTGVITPGTSTVGTYVVSYTVSGVVSNFTFQIVADKASGFNYGGSNLQQIGYATPTFDSGVQTGGTFMYSSSTGGTLSITQNPSSLDNGKIDLSNSTIGTYSISYASPGPCSTTTSITINVVAVSVDLIANNYAMSFNGTDQYVSADTTLSGLGISTAFSVSTWFNSSDLGLYDTIISAPTGAAAWDSGFGLQIVNSKLRFWINKWNSAGTPGSHVDSVTLSSNTWYHAVGTFDSNTGIKLYINAGTPSSNTQTILDGLSNPINIGVSISLYYFKGSIDEVAIWSRALESAEIQRIYNATANNPGKTANLFTGGLNNSLVYWNRMGD